jgi:polysaccharide export outer membrane protein
VGADGSLDMPLIGRVDVRNQTADAIAEVLEQHYGQRYLAKPDITVQVLASNQRTVVVEGGVRNPGNFPVAGSTTLLGILAEADGIDPEHGNERRVAVFRKVEGHMMAAAFDVPDIRQGRMANPEIYPGDLVVVDSARARALFRDIISAIPTAAVFTNL